MASTKKQADTKTKGKASEEVPAKPELNNESKEVVMKKASKGSDSSENHTEKNIMHNIKTEKPVEKAAKKVVDKVDKTETNKISETNKEVKVPKEVKAHPKRAEVTAQVVSPEKKSSKPSKNEEKAKSGVTEIKSVEPEVNAGLKVAEVREIITESKPDENVVKTEIISKPTPLPDIKPLNLKEDGTMKSYIPENVRYSDADLEEFHIKIVDMRREALEELGMLKDRLEDLTNYDFAEESMIYSMHMAEQGSEAMEKEKTYAQIQRINEYLKKLDEALQRINNKTYGICRVCGCLIAKERLLAVPITTLSASYKIHKKCPENGLDVIEPVKG